MNYTIIVDGNDGTGKSTLVKSLLKLGYSAFDRGIPTKMTDEDALNVDANRKDILYIILDGTVEQSRKRLGEAGKDLTEKYHTVEDLTYYRQKYLEVYDRLYNAVGKNAIRVVTTNSTPEETLVYVVGWLIYEHDLQLAART
jgi:thymidylate kinase